MSGDTGDRTLDELQEKQNLYWNWETEIYYGGEVIKANVIGTDTVKVSVFENGDHGPVILGETGMLPLRVLVDGNKRAKTTQKMTCINKYAGLISLELQMIRRLQAASGRPFEPGCLRVILKEAILLNSKARAPGNLITKIEF